MSETQGPLDGFEVLRKASLSLEQVQDQSCKYFEQTKRLFLYVEGEIYYQNRDYKKAIKCLESSLDLVKHPSKPDTNLARCYNALGNCYYGVNNVEKALEYYTKALKVREKLSGSEYHYDMPVYKNQIGTVYEAKGEYEEAVKWYKEALRLLEDLKISGYEDEALFCRNLANVLIRQEKYHKAIEPAEKAYNIRQKRLGTHPDTIRSIFQLGVLEANLRAYHKALDHFLTAWKMEKSLVAGNHSEVWRLIIKGVFDMYDFLKIKEVDKEKFRQEALEFCQHFWKGEIMSPHFSFTAFNKGIIDCILDLLSDTEEERDLRDEYKNLALWFDEGMQKEEDDVINPLTKQVFIGKV